jgi:hypothetical protein
MTKISEHNSFENLYRFPDLKCLKNRNSINALPLLSTTGSNIISETNILIEDAIAVDISFLFNKQKKCSWL